MLKLLKKLEELTKAGTVVNVKWETCDCDVSCCNKRIYNEIFGSIIDSNQIETNDSYVEFKDIKEISYEVEDITETFNEIMKEKVKCEISSTWLGAPFYLMKKAIIQSIGVDDIHVIDESYGYQTICFKDVKSISYQQDHIKVTVTQKKKEPIDLTGKTFIEQLRLIRDETRLMDDECKMHMKKTDHRYTVKIVSFDDDKVKYKFNEGWDYIKSINTITFSNGLTIVNEDVKAKEPMTLRGHLVKLMNDKTVCDIESIYSYKNSLIRDVKQNIISIDGYLFGCPVSDWTMDIFPIKTLTYTDEHGRKVTVNKDGSVDVENKKEDKPRHSYVPDYTKVIKPATINQEDVLSMFERFKMILMPRLDKPKAWENILNNLEGKSFAEKIRACIKIEDFCYSIYFKNNDEPAEDVFIRECSDDEIYFYRYGSDRRDSIKRGCSKISDVKFILRTASIASDDCFVIENDEPKKKSFNEELEKAKSEDYFKYPCDVYYKNGEVIKDLLIGGIYGSLHQIRFNDGRFSNYNMIDRIVFKSEYGNLKVVKNLE